METYEQLNTIINSLQLIIQNMERGMINTEILKDVELTVREVNKCLYQVEILKFQRTYSFENYVELSAYAEELRELIAIWKQTVENRGKNRIDAGFWEIYDYFKYIKKETICQGIINYFMSLPEEQRQDILELPSICPFMQKQIDYTKGDFSLIIQHVEVLTEQIEKFRWLYERLEDYRSKAVFVGILRYWCNFDRNKLFALNESIFSEYFDLDIYTCDKDAVLVDLGAFIGDSILGFVKNYKEFKKIYAYEITPAIYNKLVDLVADYENIYPINKGVSSASGNMYIHTHGLGAANKLSDDGEIKVEVVTLDEDIKEPISVIKMDIEGAEKDALRGAKRHIIDEKPVLAISAYHFPEDLVAIPELILSMRDDYKFYLRYNGKKVLWPCDYVLYAV